MDDGTTHQFGKEIPFRASLENAVANMKTDTGEGMIKFKNTFKKPTQCIIIKFVLEIVIATTPSFEVHHR